MPADKPARGTSTYRSTTVGSPPPQAVMGLLDYVTAHSLDEDYSHVSERKATTGEKREVHPGVTALIVLGIFGLLVATAAVQTSRNASVVSSARTELVTQIRARTAEVGQRRDLIDDLRRDIVSLRGQSARAASQTGSVTTRLNRLSIGTGAAAVTGPGIKVVVDDAPGAISDKEQVLDRDLQTLVNGLWEAGAEAVAINGQRISNLSAVRHAGGAITVNYRSLSRPYVVTAIGNPNQMPARFIETSAGSTWLDLERTYGLQFDMTSEESLTLPAAPRLNLRYAQSGDTR